MEEIEIHADICAESWIDPVGELQNDAKDYMESEEPFIEPVSEHKDDRYVTEVERHSEITTRWC